MLAALAGPAAAQGFRIPASEQTAQAVQSTGALVLLRQSEIGATYYRANTRASSVIAALPGVGFLSALLAGATEGVMLDSINDTRAKQAIAVAVPVRSALEGYEFAPKFQQSLQDALRGVEWLKLRQVSFGDANGDAELQPGEPEAARLFIVARYSMSPGMRYARLWCVATLLAHADTLKEIAARERPDDKLPRLYRNEFMHIETFDGPPVPAAEAAQRWSENGGARIRAALDRAADEVARMMAADIANANPAPDANPVVYAKTTAAVVSQAGGRYILRLANGTMRSVPIFLVDRAADPTSQ